MVWIKKYICFNGIDENIFSFNADKDQALFSPSLTSSFEKPVPVFIANLSYCLVCCTEACGSYLYDFLLWASVTWLADWLIAWIITWSSGTD